MLIILQFRWFGLGEVSITDPMFWMMILTSALVGAIFVFPFNYWLARRGYFLWPSRVTLIDDSITQDGQKVLPSLRDSWWALLLSIALLVACLGLTITMIF